MRCPLCKHQTRVTDTAPLAKKRVRQRQCKNVFCGHKFKTEEKLKKCSR